MVYLYKKMNQAYFSRTPMLSISAFRLFDIIVSLSMLILLSPLLLLIAVSVKSSSKGPIFFRQIRYGLNQNKFTIYKFRTMKITANQVDFQQCIKDDPRITLLGRYLRKFSLDELAQLYNVLRGDMAIVGPRPHAVDMDDKYLKTIPQYAERYHVKSGITGLAQIRGHRGPTDTLKKITGRLNADREYISTKSIFNDLIIMALTLPALIKPKNAF